MMHDLGHMRILACVVNEVLAGVAFVAIIGAGLFLAVTIILLLGKAIRFAWGW